MSLINDALKRTQEKQPAVPSAPGPELRPVAQDHTVPEKSSLMLPITIVLIALLTMVGVWGYSKLKASKAPIEARALTPPAEPQKAPETKSEVAALPQAAVSSAESASVPQPGATALATPVSPETGPASNSAPHAVVAPAPKPLKLQSIVYSRRPSAMISGRIVTTGDKIQGYKVADIRADRVLLWSEEGTISLTLE